MSEPASVSEKEQFLVTLFLQDASLLELECLEELGSFNFKIVGADYLSAVIECKFEDALRLIRRTGGSFKIARILGNNISDALAKASIPFASKFNWTVSAYGCGMDLFNQAREELHEFLKVRNLGKSKFLEPEIQFEDTGEEKIRTAELKSSEVHSRILFPPDGKNGMDFVLHGGKGGKQIFAETVGTSDFQGYEERDFMRPFQDPKKTISPRIARILVNLATTSGGLSLLDPFCGLGTVLQEALFCGHSVIGIDRDQSNIQKSMTNLEWIKTNYLFRRRYINLFAYDARRISRARMPKVDAIASEPILLPILRENPSPFEAKQLLMKVASIYERSIREFNSVLTEKWRRFAITTPTLIDSSGKPRSLSVEDVATSEGFRPYRGKFSGRNVKYPLEMKTTKRKIVQRAINLYYVP